MLVTDTEKDPVNPGPESLARVYGLDGSLRDEIDLAEVMGTERHVLEETNDWAPPDGSEALITDIEWAPDGTRLAVSTYPGFFEPDCPPPAARPCEALVWTFDRDGGDPVPGPSAARPTARRGASGMTPILTSLAWTPDGSRLGMVLSIRQSGAGQAPAQCGRARRRVGACFNPPRVRRVRDVLAGPLWVHLGTRRHSPSGHQR